MARTFEQAKEEKAVEQGEQRPNFEGGDWFPEVSGGEIDGSLLAERFEGITDILRGFPGEVPGEAPDRVQVPDLEGLDTPGLLRVIAQTLIETLNQQIDIANFVSPPSTITVSGTTSIDDDNEAQLVVPSSSGSNIPTRVLFIRNDPSNSDSIYFGDNQVQPQDGFVLEIGEWRAIPLNLAEDDFYMASETENQVVQLLGVF